MEAKVREIARKHQGTLNDAQYLSLIYAIEEAIKWKDEQHNKNVKTWQLELEKKQILIGELYEQIGKLVEELHKKD